MQHFNAAYAGFLRQIARNTKDLVILSKSLGFSHAQIARQNDYAIGMNLWTNMGCSKTPDGFGKLVISHQFR